MYSKFSFLQKLDHWANMAEFNKLELKFLYEMTGSKLLIACAVGDLELVKEIYKSGEEDINGNHLKDDFANMSPLFFSLNHMEVFKFLYKEGARFNPKEVKHESALHLVCCRENLTTAYSLAEFLIENDYKVSAQDVYGQNVLADYLNRETGFNDLLSLLLARLLIENESSFRVPQDTVDFIQKQKHIPPETLLLANIIHILEKAGSPIAYLTAGLILANFIEIQDPSSIDQPDNYYEKRLHDAITFIEKAGQHLDWNDDAFHYLFEIRAIYGETYPSITDRLGCYPLQSMAETNKCFKQTEVTAPIPYFIFWNKHLNEKIKPKNPIVIPFLDEETAEEPSMTCRTKR